MMQNLLLAEGDIIKFKSTSLPKGTYVKLRPQSKDFLDISNPKAVLETTLRRYSCLTTGDSILINYNNKRFFIDIFETKPQRAVTIIEARALPCVERGNRPLTQRFVLLAGRRTARWTLPPRWTTWSRPPSSRQLPQLLRGSLQRRDRRSKVRDDAFGVDVSKRPGALTQYPSQQHRLHPLRLLLSPSSRHLWAPLNGW